MLIAREQHLFGFRHVGRERQRADAVVPPLCPSEFLNPHRWPIGRSVRARREPAGFEPALDPINGGVESCVRGVAPVLVHEQHQVHGRPLVEAFGEVRERRGGSCGKEPAQVAGQERRLARRYALPHRRHPQVARRAESQARDGASHHTARDSHQNPPPPPPPNPPPENPPPPTPDPPELRGADVIAVPALLDRLASDAANTRGPKLP